MALFDNLIFYIDGSEASGNASDTSGAGNDFTDNNSVLTRTVSGQAYRDFNGSTQFMDHADEAEVSTGDIVYSIAIQCVLDNITTNQAVMSKFLNTGNQREYLLYFNHDNDTPADTFIWAVSGSGLVISGQIAASTFGTPSTGVPLFIVCSHNATADTLKISVNNGTADSVAYVLASFDGTASVMLGSMFAGATFNLDGGVRCAGFWKRDLFDTPTDITAIYNGGVVLTGAEVLNGGPFAVARVQGRGQLTGLGRNKLAVHP